MLKLTACICAFVFSAILAIVLAFTSSGVSTNSGLRGGAIATEFNPDSYDPDLPIISGDFYTSEFILTTYFPDSPEDPLGGGSVCSDGTRFFRDPDRGGWNDLYAVTPDGRTIQGVVATVQDQHSPAIPWSMKDDVTLSVPGYYSEAEIHDHFASCVTHPKRLDIALSGSSAAKVFFERLEAQIGEVKSFKGSSNYNCGTLVPVTVNYSGLISDARSLLISYTLEELGKPYVWATAGPDTFDCSGLTSYVYSRIGIRVSRSSYAQAAMDTRVSITQMLPGDIVIMKGGGHVGIYIGGDEYVHAPCTGDVVKISPLSARGDLNYGISVLSGGDLSEI